jgi:hypothetical protein
MFDQFVVITPDAKAYVEQYVNQGYGAWLTDTCEQTGWMKARDTDRCYMVSFQATMFFNYDIMPGQVFEVIQYDRYDLLKHLWPEEDVRRGRPLLLATQIVSSLEAYLQLSSQEEKVRWRYRTRDHTAPHIVDNNRWFDHAVFDTYNEFGFISKVMEKRYDG